jgi:rod shape determining protein RodA
MGRVDGGTFTALLIAWRPYVYDALVFWFLNVAMGTMRCRSGSIWSRTSRIGCSPSSIPRSTPGPRAITPSVRVAIGSGGWFGTGYTQGPQKRLAFLPEQHTDFVFPVVGEELGFIGVMVALSLFLALFLALLRIARRATDSFSSLVTFGILALFFTHVFENVGMTVN